MKLKNFIPIFLIFALFACTNETKETKETLADKNPLLGTWELVSGTWVREDTTYNYLSTPYEKHMKIIGETNFATVAQDTSRSGSVFNGGTYTFDNDIYTEAITYQSQPNNLGNKHSFKVKLEGDNLFISSCNEVGEIVEIGFFQEWKKLTPELQEEENPMVGSWEMVSGEWTTKDTAFSTMVTPHEKHIKIIDKRHFVTLGQDTSLSHAMFNGGIHDLNNDIYTETHQYFSDPTYIGESFSFKVKFEGDRFFISTYVEEGDTTGIRGIEEWKRIK